MIMIIPMILKQSIFSAYTCLFLSEHEIIRHIIVKLYGRHDAPKILSRRNIVLDRSNFYWIRKIFTFYLLYSCLKQLNLEYLKLLDGYYYSDGHHGISAIDHIISVVRNERQKRFINHSFIPKPPQLIRTRTMHFNSIESIQKCALQTWEFRNV